MTPHDTTPHRPRVLVLILRQSRHGVGLGGRVGCLLTVCTDKAKAQSRLSWYLHMRVVVVFRVSFVYRLWHEISLAL